MDDIERAERDQIITRNEALCDRLAEAIRHTIEVRLALGDHRPMETARLLCCQYVMTSFLGIVNPTVRFEILFPVEAVRVMTALGFNGGQYETGKLVNGRQIEALGLLVRDGFLSLHMLNGAEVVTFAGAIPR